MLQLRAHYFRRSLKAIKCYLSDICMFWMLCSDIAILLIGSVCLILTLLSAIHKKSNRSKAVPIMSEFYLFLIKNTSSLNWFLFCFAICCETAFYWFFQFSISLFISLFFWINPINIQIWKGKPTTVPFIAGIR